MRDEEILFRCKCGHYGFLEVSIFHWEDGEPSDYYFCFIDEPKGFLEKLHWLFKKKKYVSEIVMSRKDVEKLAKVLKRGLKGEKK